VSRVFRIALAAMLAMGAALAGAPATAQPPEPVPGLPLHLALGDSIANGQQSAPIVAGDYWATVAAFQAAGYVAQYNDVLVEELDCVPGKGRAAGPGCRQLQLLNLARSAVPDEVEPPDGRPGVTAAIVIEEQLPVAVPLLQARNGDANPRNDIPVVTLTVGGNDVFGPIADACLPTPGPDCASVIGAEFATFAAEYGQILAQLRAAAGPDTAIVTMSYYNPVPYCALGQGNPLAGIFVDLVLEGGSLGGFTLPIGLNDLIRGISAVNGALVAEAYGALGEGDFVGGTDCLHPTLSGHTKIAAAFAAAYSG
jgi:hypothetical protein